MRELMFDVEVSERVHKNGDADGSLDIIRPSLTFSLIELEEHMAHMRYFKEDFLSETGVGSTIVTRAYQNDYDEMQRLSRFILKFKGVHDKESGPLDAKQAHKVVSAVIQRQ